MHAWSLEYTSTAHQRLMVDTYEGRKPMASWRRPPGRPHNVWLSNVQEDANAPDLSTAIYAVKICDRQRSITARRNGHSDYVTTTTAMMMMTSVKNGGKTNFSRHLQAVANRPFFECLKSLTDRKSV